MMKVKLNQLVKWSVEIFLFLLIYSCSTKSQKLFSEISLLQSGPIDCGLNELINDSIWQKKMKYIVYSDSTRCTPCRINKMYIWNSFLEYSKNYNSQLSFYFIFCPAKKDIEGIKLAIINNSKFNYPIFLDTLGEFEKLNPHLPKNKALHSFLLDENNNVILVGDPLYNKEIKELFYKIVEEKLGKPQEQPFQDSVK